MDMRTDDAHDEQAQESWWKVASVEISNVETTVRENAGALKPDTTCDEARTSAAELKRIFDC